MKNLPVIFSVMLLIFSSQFVFSQNGKQKSKASKEHRENKEYRKNRNSSGKEDGKPNGERMFETLDQNNDGRISRSEYDNMKQKRNGRVSEEDYEAPSKNQDKFDRMDADNNGYITRDEFDLIKNQKADRQKRDDDDDDDHEDGGREKKSKRYDDDQREPQGNKQGKGKKDVEDADGGFSRPVFNQQRFDEMDQNNNGKISYGEFKKSDLAKRENKNKNKKKLFDRLDRNDDNAITRDELGIR